MCICMYVCTGMSACICANVYVCEYDCFCFCIYICKYVFISIKIMPFFFNLLTEDFQQCTKVKRSKVYTSASTFLKINL